MTEYWSWTYFCFITLDYCINVFIYFKNKITSILELKMIKYYLFAIHLYSKLRVLNSVLYALADQNMFTVTCSIRTVSNEISNIETNSNLYDEKIGDNVPTMHRYLWTLKQANTIWYIAHLHSEDASSHCPI